MDQLSRRLFLSFVLICCGCSSPEFSNHSPSDNPPSFLKPTQFALVSAATPTVTISASKPQAAETPGAPGAFTLLRSGSVAASLTVKLSFSGSALSGSDYVAIPAMQTFPSGAATLTIALKVVNDLLPEAPETLVATLLPDSAYSVGSPGSAAVNVVDNDQVSSAIVVTPFCSGTTSKANVTWSAAGQGGQGYHLAVDTDADLANGLWYKLIPIGILTAAIPDGLKPYNVANPLQLADGGNYTVSIYYNQTGNAITTTFTAAACGVNPTPTPPPSSGWTNFGTPNKTFYVSDSQGNDTWDGLSQTFSSPNHGPLKTIDKALHTSCGGNDWAACYEHILLKKGDTFTNQYVGLHNSGLNDNQKYLVGSYGTGPRPRVLPPAGMSGIFLFGGGEMIRYAAVAGIDFSSQPGGQYWTPGVYAIVIGVEHFLIEDVAIHGFDSGIIFQWWAPNPPPKDIKLRRNLIYDNPNGQGMFVGGGVDGMLIEENLWYRNGGTPDDSKFPANIFNHNLYITNGTKNIILRNNIIANASSHGVQMRAGGVIENNLFVRNPIAALTGGGNDPQVETNGIFVDIRNNVVMEGTNIGAADGMGRGWGIGISNVSSGFVVDNVIAGNKAGKMPIALMLSSNATGDNGALTPAGIENVQITGNRIYNWTYGTSGQSSLGTFRIEGTDLSRIFGLTLINNDVVNTQNASTLIEHAQSGITTHAFVASANNRFFSPVTNPIWEEPTGYESVPTWRSHLGPLGQPSIDNTSAMLTAQQLQALYPDPSRTVETYMTTQGGSGTDDQKYQQFINELLKQSKDNWRLQFTADAVNDYIRAGFGK